jgi:hypothetical protein
MAMVGADDGRVPPFGAAGGEFPVLGGERNGDNWFIDTYKCLQCGKASEHSSITKFRIVFHNSPFTDRKCHVSLWKFCGFNDIEPDDHYHHDEQNDNLLKYKCIFFDMVVLRSVEPCPRLPYEVEKLLD